MSDLAQLGARLFHPQTESRPKIASTEKRVRGLLNGEFIFDTTAAKLVWEIKYFPQYWIPASDLLPAANVTADNAISGIQSSTSRLTVNNKSIKILIVPDSFNSELAGYVKINFGDLDAWYEELSQVLYHPKDPFHRVDILPSGRHVRVEIDGVVLADSGNEGGIMSLWETNLPGRWYIPKTALRGNFLKESSTKTGCPYKGQASYYNAVVKGQEYKDVAWWYENPTTESSLIKGMLCFYPDKVDTFVDGKAIEKIGMPNIKEQQQQHDHGKTCGC